MPEYIEREALYQKIEERYKYSSGAAHKAYGIAVDDVLDAPAVDVEHLRDLINAEDEGRLIVLPCKPGNEVYIVNELCSDIWDDRAYVIGPYPVRHACEKGFFYESMAIGLCFMRWDSVGKTAFWNRDEAYAAMNKLK